MLGASHLCLGWVFGSWTKCAPLVVNRLVNFRCLRSPCTIFGREAPYNVCELFRRVSKVKQNLCWHLTVWPICFLHSHQVWPLDFPLDCTWVCQLLGWFLWMWFRSLKKLKQEMKQQQQQQQLFKKLNCWTNAESQEENLQIRVTCLYTKHESFNCYPLTQHNFWSGVGCFACNTFHVW